MGLNIRKATASDADAILTLVALMVTESPTYRRHSFAFEKATNLIKYLTDVQCLIVAEKNGEVIGFCSGIVSEQLLSYDKYATDTGIYILPEHRGGTAFVRLVRAFEAWAKEQGATEVQLGVSTGINTDRTVCIYERLNYKMSSHGLIKTEI